MGRRRPTRRGRSGRRLAAAAGRTRPATQPQSRPGGWRPLPSNGCSTAATLPTSESRSFLPEIFLISGAALLLEISYTRIISFKLFYYYTYLVIGLALLGLGSGGVIVAVSGRLRRTGTDVAPALVHRWPRRPRSSSATSSSPTMPLDTLAIWEAATGAVES